MQQFKKLLYICSRLKGGKPRIHKNSIVFAALKEKHLNSNVSPVGVTVRSSGGLVMSIWR